MDDYFGWHDLDQDLMEDFDALDLYWNDMQNGLNPAYPFPDDLEYDELYMDFVPTDGKHFCDTYYDSDDWCIEEFEICHFYKGIPAELCYSLFNDEWRWWDDCDADEEEELAGED